MFTTLTLWPLFGKNNVVGHVPQNLCGFFWRFLTLPGTSIPAEVLGRRVNRGAGHGLEVPVRFIFQGHRKAVEWVQKKIKTADNDIQERFKRCMKKCNLEQSYVKKKTCKDHFI